jgi:hypothetical protein
MEALREHTPAEPDEHPTPSRSQWRWCAVLSLLGLVTYARGLRGEYFSDDFQYYFEAPPSPLYFFTHRNPYVNWSYRPIEAVFLVFVQQHFGSETWPIHAVLLMLHIALALLVFLWMRRAGFGDLAALLGSAFMLVAQANGHAVLSNDTFSQIAGTLCGYLSLLLLHELVSSRPEDAWSMHACALRAGSVVAFAASLAGKETSVGFLASAFLVLVAMQLRRVRILLELIPFVAILIGYFGVRSFLGLKSGHLGTGRVDLQVGPGVIKNILLYLLVTVLPASSADTFVAVRLVEVPRLVATGLGVAAFCAALWIGLWRARDRRVGLFALIGLLGLFPSVALNRPSELYAYNAMPALAVCVGVAFAALLRTPLALGRWRPAIWAWVALLLLLNVAAVWSKAGQMSDMGRRATSLLRQIDPHARALPPNGRLVLVQPEPQPPEYSVFYMSGFNVLSNGTFMIQRRAGRPDIEVDIVRWRDLPRFRDSRSRILTLDGDRVLSGEGNLRE